MFRDFQDDSFKPWCGTIPVPEASHYPETPDRILTTVSAARKATLKEEADDYPRVVCQLNDHWRVILCKDGIQWILQKWAGQRWRGRSYCTTKSALLRCIVQHSGEIEKDGQSILDELPERI